MGLLKGFRSSISRAVSSMFADDEPKRIGIYGPPNAGKCLAPDETVLLADGTHRQIKDIFQDVAADDPPDVSDTAGERWLECEGISVPALGADRTVEPRPVSHVFRQEYHGDLIRVETSSGRRVTASPSHPFIVERNGELGTEPAGTITTGTEVATLPATDTRLAQGEIDQPPTPASEPGRYATDGGTVISDSTGGPTATASCGDIAWEKVVRIERVDHDGYIYDLTVPDRHTFTTADGLIVHNTTLANRIVRDWTEHGDAVGPESHVPHETRRARRKEDIEIERDGRTVTIDVVDTPGVTTKVDYTEFLDHDMEKEDAVRRSREATEGVAEAMHWLREDVDGVIYVLDSAEDPFTQVNTMLIGIIESQDLPVLILANKIDLEDSSIQRIRNAFPQHETIPLSALEGDNMDEVYDKIAEYFG